MCIVPLPGTLSHTIFAPILTLTRCRRSRVPMLTLSAGMLASLLSVADLTLLVHTVPSEEKPARTSSMYHDVSDSVLFLCQSIPGSLRQAQASVIITGRGIVAHPHQVELAVCYTDRSHYNLAGFSAIFYLKLSMHAATVTKHDKFFRVCDALLHFECQRNQI